MMYKIPFSDPSPDRNDHCGEPKLPAPPAIIRKATFQWPPVCGRSRIVDRSAIRKLWVGLSPTTVTERITRHGKGPVGE